MFEVALLYCDASNRSAQNHHGDKDRACLLRVQGKIQNAATTVSHYKDSTLQLDEALAKRTRAHRDAPLTPAVKDVNVTAQGVLQSEANFTVRTWSLPHTI